MTRDEKWLLDEKYGGTPTDAYEKDKVRLAGGEPVGYVIGWQPFLGLKIFLDSKPLIPRPETEWWTEQMLEESPCATSKWSGLPGEAGTGNPRTFARSTERLLAKVGNALQKVLGSPRGLGQTILHDIPHVRFLDLCAGSGAIGCVILARIPSAQVYFGEIDPAHAPTILKNIRENQLAESRADIRIGDLFAPFQNMTFDVIAINPPYIPNERVLDDSVSKFEPHQALFSGTNGLDLISRIARELSAHLVPGGTAWIECDISNIASAETLFATQGFTTKIRTDQYGAPRILIVLWP